MTINYMCIPKGATYISFLDDDMNIFLFLVFVKSFILCTKTLRGRVWRTYVTSFFGATLILSSLPEVYVIGDGVGIAIEQGYVELQLHI